MMAHADSLQVHVLLEGPGQNIVRAEVSLGPKHLSAKPGTDQTTDLVSNSRNKLPEMLKACEVNS